VPIVGEYPLDLDTPVALYKCFEKEPYSFLLESVEGGETWGRFSFIGLSPSVVLRGKGRQVEITQGSKRTTIDAADPLAELKKVLHAYEAVAVEGLPRFSGGAVGWISYDMVRFFERIPDRGKKDITTPDLAFMIPQILLIADSFAQTLKIVYDARIEKGESLQTIYQRGVRMIQKTARQISRRPVDRPKATSAPRWKASLSQETHRQMIEKTREYIFAGDITQAVISLSFQGKTSLQPLPLYRALRRVNPSPYMFLMKFGKTSLVGASPETMVRLEDGRMTLRPIAGTRPRGRTHEEDQALETELLADEKERAEHIMLVDLGRNDLGRVASSGTVHVDELMTVERYSHVMHIVSNVTANLEAGKDAFDVLRATFPAGTLSGSPKIRAMEIIEELEPTRRGYYGGCVGYFDYSGNMDVAITIRSALLENGMVTVQSGGGIVADSKPEVEYQECMNKAKAMMKAIELACKG
jgi:anthranilate synthase component 1